MDPIIIAVIVILCQYPLAMLTLMKMFKLKFEKTLTIIWDVAIVALPFVGVVSFWLAYLIKYRKSKPISEDEKTSPSNFVPQVAEEDKSTEKEPE